MGTATDPGATPRVRRYGETGAAPPWVLLHGWGFDGAVLVPLAERLARDRPVLVIDLPGFAAGSAARPGTDVDRLAEAVLERVPGPARWLGWSLGGLVALAAAQRRPREVLGVDLLASTPRFVAAADWPGIATAELDAFIDAVAAAPERAHRRFLAYQLGGGESARAVQRQLRGLVARQGMPPAAALADGLSILRDTDLRTRLDAVSCPLRAVLGASDPLVPAAVADRLAARGVRVRVIDGAAHAPFLSHPQAVAAALQQPVATTCR